jgi:hypothetical protein
MVRGMLARVHKRGWRVAGLLRYLLGPGRAEEHVNSRYPEVGTPYGRLVVCSDGAVGLLQPVRDSAGRWDHRPAVSWLEAPARVAGLLDGPAGSRPRLVHHFSVRLAPEDRWRSISDQTWGHMIGEIMRGAGLTPADGGPGCRWVVVRHSDDHVHVVTTLVRADGRREWFGRDMPRLVDATARVAARMGLRVVARTGTGHRHPGPAELRKAARLRRTTSGGRELLTARDELRRRVRAAAVASVSPGEFEAQLAAHGVQVAYRTSNTQPGVRTGITFALAGDAGRDGTPVWYGGGKLAPELSWPRLQSRWSGDRAIAGPSVRAGRLRLFEQAEQAARLATAGRGTADPALELGVADCLTANGWLLDRGPGGSLVAAAERFDHAIRRPRGAPASGPPAVGVGAQLRVLAYSLFQLGRVATDDEERAALRLAYVLAALADRLAQLSGRAERATRMRAAAAAVRAAAAGRPAAGGRPARLARLAGATPPQLVPVSPPTPRPAEPAPAQPRPRRSPRR